MKINEAEAEELVGHRIVGAEGARKAAHYVLDQGVSVAVITQGNDGALIAGAEGDFFCRPPTFSGWIDVGSGDSMMAGLAVGVGRGLKLYKTAKMATAAAVSNMKRGFGQVDLREIEVLSPQVTVESMSDT